MAGEKEVVRVYRRILKLAQRYPSVKRDAIIRDIKLEFHDHKALTDVHEIHEKLASAHAGIKELSQYAGLNPTAMNWTVDIGREAVATEGPSSASIDGGISVKVVGDKSN